MRVRTLVNPFSVRESIPAVHLAEIFENPALPVDLEIGTGQGNFFRELCRKLPQRNHLGIELRYQLAHHLNRQLQKQNLKNGRVFYGNVHHSLENLLDGHLLEAVYLFFPDPWEKRRHANRRILTPELARRLAQALSPTGRIYIQTDVESLLSEFREVLQKIPQLQPLHPQNLCPETLWRGEIGELHSNRETDALKAGLPIYRSIYTRSAKII